MAIAIKSVPILKGKIAKDFERKTNANAAKKATVNFSKELAAAAKILTKANLK